jgi:hypothetical protein
MPEMDNGVKGDAAGFGDDVPDLRPGTVVGNDNLKVGEGLACTRGKNKPEDFRLVVYRDDKRDFRDRAHAPI